MALHLSFGDVTERVIFQNGFFIVSFSYHSQKWHLEQNMEKIIMSNNTIHGVPFQKLNWTPRNIIRNQFITFNCCFSRFGPHSIEVGHELIKYTDVLLGDLQDTTKRSSQYGEKLMEARVCLERASQIFELHYGAWHKSHQELVQKLNRINFLIDT